MLSGMYGKVQSTLLNILQIKLYNQQLFESARKKLNKHERCNTIKIHPINMFTNNSPSKFPRLETEA